MERLRRRLALAILAFFACWPAVHHLLVLSADVDPWRLGGQAMYTTPRLAQATALVLQVDGQLIPVPPEMYDPQQRARIQAWTLRRRALGELLSPEPLAAEILAEAPQLDGLRIIVRQQRLDPDSARIVEEEQTYRYTRDVIGN